MNDLKKLTKKELRSINGGGPIADWICEKTKDLIFWFQTRGTSDTIEELDGYGDGSYLA